MDVSAAYDEVYAYTMTRPGFILQHVVDAYGAQTASADSKPMRLIFSLAGLYLHIEKQFTGRQVQLAHMQMGRRKREWPALPLPRDRGAMTAADVLAAPAGLERDAAIEAWCRSVWDAYHDARQTIIDVLAATGVTTR